MSLPVVLRSTLERAQALAAQIEFELRTELDTLRETLTDLRDHRDALEGDRDRTAAAMARAIADKDRLAANLEAKEAELARMVEALAAHREEGHRAEARAAAEGSAREQAQMALADAEGRLAKTSRRLDDFRA